METKKLNWAMVRNELLLINPDLVQLIDNIDPDEEYAIYEAQYTWGQHLLQDGTLYLPDCDKYVPLSSINPTIAEDLSYNANLPIGIVMDKSIESYLEELDQVTPLTLIPKGSIFGLDNLDNPIHTNIIAGSRSSLLLPSMRDDTAFRKLGRKFNTKSQPPKSISHEWHVFRELANHESISKKWTTRVIYFSRKWFEPQNSVNWQNFKIYLLEHHINSNKSVALMNQLFFDLAFSCTSQIKSLKPNPYLLDTVKHIFAISQDIYPGYKVALDDSALPLNVTPDVKIHH